MNSPLIRLKVPQGLVKKANQLKVWNDVLFYYKMKSLRVEGSFHKSEVVKVVSGRFGYSEPSIWRKLRKLIDLGYVFKVGDHYCLVSYDVLFKKLGFTLVETKKKKRSGFPIFRIESRDLNNFLDYIGLEEIKSSFFRQRKSLKSSEHIGLIQNHSLETFKQMFRKSNINQKIDSLLDLKSLSYLIAKGVQDVSLKQNLDITISCFGISRLLGFLSPSTGYAIERRLEELGLIQIRRRKFLVECNPLLVEKVYQSLKHIPNFILKENKVYLIYTNELLFS